MSKVIAADQAKVSTVSVDIQVVRVGNKQMTLAVFKQLVRKPLIDWNTVQLRGIPWGWVNYHKDCISADHLHVIWQDGNRLLRNDVYQYYIYKTSQWEEIRSRAKEALADAAAVHFLQREPEDGTGFWREFREKLKQNGLIECRLGGVDLSVSPGEFTVLQAVKEFLWRKEERWRSEAEVRLRDKYGEVPDFQELWEKVQNAVGEAEQILDKWDKLYSSLKSLPQLFIAV